MKLLNFTVEDSLHLGAIHNDEVIDLTRADNFDHELSSVTNFLRGGDAALHKAKTLLDRLKEGHSPRARITAITHAPLISRECRIFAVGLNYRDHAAENNLEPPKSPIFFAKLASIITPHLQSIVIPDCSDQIDYEAEFAVVIGSRAKRVSEAEAEHCIAGYTTSNDITARDLQARDGQWFRAKNCDGFAAIGPWLVTRDEVRDPNNLDITLRLNGRVRQHSNTSNLVFKPPQLISVLSQTITLEPGDIIITGTPGGIGFYANPKVFLKPGDICEVEIAGIGTLQNSFAAPESKASSAAN